MGKLALVQYRKTLQNIEEIAHGRHNGKKGKSMNIILSKCHKIPTKITDLQSCLSR